MANDPILLPSVTGESVTVRMYRGLLGDCFLLTHEVRPEPKKPPKRVFRTLIDCGVLQCIGTEANKPNTKAAVRHMAQVVENLARDTGGVLDLVIATHEHYDHLSGFILHFATFHEFTIKQVWLAWTENAQDELAKFVTEHQGRGLRQLIKATKVQPFRAAADEETERRQAAILDLLQFHGLDEGFERESEDTTAETTKAPRSCKAVIDWLKGKAETVRYLDPGEVVTFGLDARLTAHVLGPPRDAKNLLQLNPTEGAGREVYLTKPDDVAALEATLRLLYPDPNAQTKPARNPEDYPFSARFDRLEDEKAPSNAVASLYYKASAEARRIDGEWLGAAESLAMKIDGDVNNTSLALAIEVSGRDVLLFPADAQVGNWLSWHDRTYPAKPADKSTPTVTAEDLLRRTVLYKVGHHGSHNATARAKGLELMTSPDLVAMIPVVKSIAAEQKTSSNPEGWAMPYGDLDKRLREKTRERIIQGDGDRVTEDANFKGDKSRFELKYDEETPDPLWAELTLKLPAP